MVHDPPPLLPALSALVDGSAGKIIPRISRDQQTGWPDVTRLCAWCENPIPAKARRDAVCCSVRCRQARHRFFRAVGYADSVAPGRPLRLAYADPPYPGKAWPYRDHPDYGGEVDHAALIAELSDYDRLGVVHLGPGAARRAGAVPRPMSGSLPGATANDRPGAGGRCTPGSQSSTRGGRQLIGGARRVDSIVCGVAPLDTLPGRVLGAKPAAVCRWIFTLLGACPGDTLDDLFPGSGAVGRGWAVFTSSPDPSSKPRADASLPAAGDAPDLGALVLVPSSPDPSCSPASDASSRARSDASSGPQLYASPKASRDASSPAASDGSYPSSEPSPDGYLFPWRLPGDRPQLAGDGLRPVRAGSGLALVF